MNIEVKAVNAVSDLIAENDYLEPQIALNDKTPIWDGDIFAYSSKSHDKESIRGKAPVQVKGKTVKKELKKLKTLSFPINKSDLVHYKKDGGVLFFVVAIHEKTKDTKVFYSALLPYRITQLMYNKSKQSTISVKMIPFPTKEEMVTNVVFNFIRDQEKQYIHTKEEVPSVEDFIKAAGKDISFGFSYTGLGYDMDKPYKYLFDNDVYMYVTNTKLNLSMVLDHMDHVDIASQIIEGDVSVNEEVYYNSFELVHTPNSDIIEIGKSTAISLDPKSSIKINYNLKGNLDEQIRDMEFMKAFLEKKCAKINKLNIPINPTADELADFKFEGMCNRLEYLKKVKRALVMVGVHDSLMMDNLEKKDDDYIRMLVKSCIYNEPIKFDDDVQAVATMTIGNLSLILHFEKTDEGYYIRNFNETDVVCQAEYTDLSRFQTSKYTILEKDDFVRLNNIDYMKLVEDVERFTEPGHLIRTNYLMLELLQVYDKHHKEHVLNCASELAKWLYEQKKDDFMRCLNHLQCVIRKRPLNADEDDILFSYLESDDANIQYRAAACILLGDTRMAYRYIEKLDSEMKEIFEHYPVYNLLIHNDLMKT